MNVGPSILGAAKRMKNVRDRVLTSEMPRRIFHGHTPRQPVEVSQYQPQDGAIDSSRRMTSMSSRLGEPEDARLTGGTRSLMRRLSGLNIPRALALPPRAVSTQLSMGNAKVA